MCGGVCACGVGVTHPLFLSIDRQEKKKIICGLVALADSCRGKKDNYIYVHHHQEFFTIKKFIVF